MKRKITEMMTISKKDERISNKGSKRPILIFHDSEKIWGISNKIFPLVIVDIFTIFDVSQVFIDGWSSYDIMYLDLF